MSKLWLSIALLVCSSARSAEPDWKVESAHERWISAVSFSPDGQSLATCGSFPMLLAGGRKLGFKHGQHLKWKGGTRPASDLYLTILQQMRCPVKSFKESTGPISELLA